MSINWEKSLEEQKTLLWWKILCAIATINILAWCVMAYSTEWTSNYTRWQVLFSGIFTAVCAFRSYRPRISLERYCLVDSYASSMAVGRSAATVAEVSFAIQVALMLHEFGGVSQVPWLQTLSIPVVVLLSVAQVFCWGGVLTRNHLWHAIEESLWAVTFAVVGVALLLTTSHATDQWIWITRSGVVFCFFYVLFMVVVDVPMYFKRWRSGEYDDQRLSLSAGWSDALHRRVCTRDWKIWKPEVAWLTGYFSIAVWISLAMAGLVR